MSVARGSLSLLAMAAACGEPFDTTRPSRPELSLGGEVYLALCNRVAAEARPDDPSGLATRDTCLYGAPAAPEDGARLGAMGTLRPAIVSALDSAVSAPLAEELEDLLRRILPVHDAGTLRAHSRATAALLDGVANDAAALASLERAAARDGYRPFDVAAGLARPLLAYPRLHELTLDLAARFDDGGPARAEWRLLLAALEHTLANAEPGLDPTGALVTSLLWSSDPELSDGTPRLLVARDARGLALPEEPSAPPFVDADADGLADADAHGRFVGGDGAPLLLGAPFRVPREPGTLQRDAEGRLLGPGGRLTYRYVDASQTLLGGMLGAFGAFLEREPAALVDLTLPAALLLGPAARQSYRYDDGAELVFDGFDVARSPLVDLVHALGSIAAAPSGYWALRLSESLLDKQESSLAAAARLGLAVDDWADEPAFAAAALERDNTLADDLFELFTEIARVPGLLEDLCAALRTPEAQSLGPIYATLMRHTDRIDYDPNVLNGPPVGSPITPVDRTRPDSTSNRSIFQRTLHLVYDTNGARLCNREGAVLDFGLVRYPLFGSYAECELFQIDDMAVFYAQAVAGVAELRFKDPLIDLAADFDTLLELMTGVDGLTRYPTPQAINRLVFAPRNSFLEQLTNVPTSADGAILEERHPGTIFAFEIAGFYDGLRPVVSAFAAHGREDLFADILSILHLHWATPESSDTQSADPAATAYSHQSGAVRFEELVARALDAGELLVAVARLLDGAAATTVEGQSGTSILASAARQLLLPEWSPGLAYRDGRTEARRADGRSVPLAPIWMLADALQAGERAVDARPEVATRLEEALSGLAHQLLAVDANLRFEERRFVAALRLLVRFASGRIAAHAGDLEAWAAGLDDRAADLLADPLVAASLRLLDAVAQDEGGRRSMAGLVGYLVALPEDPASRPYATLLTSAVDQLQLAADPDLAGLLRALAPAARPDEGFIDLTVRLLGDVAAYDERRVLPRLLGGLMQAQAERDGERVLATLLDALMAVNRERPGDIADLSAADFAATVVRLRDFLLDDAHGLERLHDLVAGR